MTVILVLTMFVAFAVIDYLIHRTAHGSQIADEPEQDRAPLKFRYHAGHTWVLHEGHNLGRVGLDAVAAQVAAPIEKIELPQPGRWVRQGQRAWAFYHNGERFEMVSPAEGEVVEINPDVLKDPSLIGKDPYGQGWLMTVRVMDKESAERNLLPSDLVPAWMRTEARKVRSNREGLEHELFLT